MSSTEKLIQAQRAASGLSKFTTEGLSASDLMANELADRLEDAVELLKAVKTPPAPRWLKQRDYLLEFGSIKQLREAIK